MVCLFVSSEHWNYVPWLVDMQGGGPGELVKNLAVMIREFVYCLCTSYNFEITLWDYRSRKEDR